MIVKAGRVNVNLIEILVSLKERLKGEKGLWNTTRNLPDRTIVAPQVVGQLFGVCLISNSNFKTTTNLQNFPFPSILLIL